MMLRKMSIVLTILLPAILLIGCNGDESGDVSTTNSQIEVRIIEDYESLELEVPLYFHMNWLHRSGLNSQARPQVLNGLTGGVEKYLEPSNYHRVRYFPVSLGDYYILPVDLADIPNLDDTNAMIIAVEYFVFDQNFNLVDSFIISEDEDNREVSDKIDAFRQVGQNEAGEWLVYGVSGNFSLIYVYNISTNEVTQIAQLNGTLLDIRVMPEVNKLAFALSERFEPVWQSHVEFGFIDLETLEVDTVHQIENITSPIMSPHWDPVPHVGEVLLVNIRTGDDEQSEREAHLVCPLTGEVRTMPIGNDDHWSSSEEEWKFSVTSDAQITSDGQLLVKFIMDQLEDPIDGWSYSNRVITAVLYDTQTGERVFEHIIVDVDTLALGESAGVTQFIPITENIYLIRTDIHTGISAENPDFFPGTLRFEYIFIEITVHDDE